MRWPSHCFPTGVRRHPAGHSDTFGVAHGSKRLPSAALRVQMIFDTMRWCQKQHPPTGEAEVDGAKVCFRVPITPPRDHAGSRMQVPTASDTNFMAETLAARCSHQPLQYCDLHQLSKYNCMHANSLKLHIVNIILTKRQHAIKAC